MAFYLLWHNNSCMQFLTKTPETSYCRFFLIISNVTCVFMFYVIFHRIYSLVFANLFVGGGEVKDKWI